MAVDERRAEANGPRDRLFEAAYATLIACALLLGGATLEGWLRQAVVRLVAVAVLAAAAWRLSDRCRPMLAAFPLGLLTAAMALPLLQLAPLPPAIWMHLPGRAMLASVYSAADAPVPWLPLSLTPDGTWNAELSLLPPAAAFLGALSLSSAARQRTVLLVLVLTVLSMALSLAQVVSGPDSALRFYRITNSAYGVGFFANRNHQTALMVAALPLAAVFWRRGAAPRAASRLIGALVIAAATLGILATRSRAGLILLLPVLAGSIAVLWADRPRRVRALLALTAAAAGAAGLILALNPYGATTRIERALAADERAAIAPNAAQAAMIYSPWGAGLGSFDPVYRSVEPMTQVSGSYFNHAHDDYLELWIETGAAGPALVILGLGWTGLAGARAWRRASSPSVDLARAASLVVGALAAHSAMDYPLRTSALATLFGFACACLAHFPPKWRPVRRRSTPAAVSKGRNR